jgi:signal transduction histidine kinase
VSAPSAELRSLQEFVRKLPLFADLTLADVAQLCRSSRRVHAVPGDLVIEEGAPGDSLYVVLSGVLEITKREGARDVVLATRRAGEAIGEMSLLERTPRSASARAVEPSELLEISPAALRSVIEKNPSTAMAMLRTVAERLRSTEASLMQSDKLASLGTLAAGLAHELNNPAAAIQRSTEHLREAFEMWRRRTVELQGLQLDAQQKARLAELEAGVADCGSPGPEDAACARHEAQLLDELEVLGVEDAAEIASALAAFGWTVARLRPVAAAFAAAHVRPVLQWLGAGLGAQQLVGEIRRSAQAISEIVRAVKSYAYLDQAPVQDADLRASLEDTLVILRHKLKDGIEVLRDFEAGLPTIEAYASELNQVWTNLIDNAIHAMDGRGVLELRARRVGADVEVRIADSGPGIPAAIASRIFDPFFTTKPQGVGTGLGLHIAHNIVVDRHHGRIDVESRPGRTEFRVWLPIRMQRAERSEPAPRSRHDSRPRE